MAHQVRVARCPKVRGTGRSGHLRNYGTVVSALLSLGATGRNWLLARVRYSRNYAPEPLRNQLG
jgi:hypothetical protein